MYKNIQHGPNLLSRCVFSFAVRGLRLWEFLLMSDRDGGSDEVRGLWRILRDPNTSVVYAKSYKIPVRIGSNNRALHWPLAWPLYALFSTSLCHCFGSFILFFCRRVRLFRRAYQSNDVSVLGQTEFLGIMMSKWNLLDLKLETLHAGFFGNVH